jgi:hypothetical protein
MRAQEAELLDLVDDGQDGLIPATKFALDPNETADQCLRRLNNHFWEDNPQPSYSKRKDKGGFFNILRQHDASDFEWICSMSYETPDKTKRFTSVMKPQLFVREDASKPFVLFDRVPLTSLNCKYLGLHAKGTLLTAFRSKQRGEIDTSWKESFKDIETWMDRETFVAGTTTHTTHTTHATHTQHGDTEEEEEEEDTEEEKDDEEEQMLQRSLEWHIQHWPLKDVSLRHLYDVNQRNARSRLNAIKQFINHTVDNKYDNPQHHVPVLVCVELWKKLPKEFLQECVQFARTWFEQEKKASEGRDTIGSFTMKMQPWQEEGTLGDVQDMLQDYVVHYPTPEQLKTWNVNDKKILFAKMMGFHVFYKLWIWDEHETTAPTPSREHDTRSIFERITQRLPLNKGTQSTPIADVNNRGKETKPYKERYVFPLDIYNNLLSMVLNKQDIVDELRADVNARKGGNLPLVPAIEKTQNMLKTVTNDLSIEFLRLRGLVAVCVNSATDLDLPVGCAGPTGVGKTTLFNAYVHLYSSLRQTHQDFATPDDMDLFTRILNHMSGTDMDSATVREEVQRYATRLEDHVESKRCEHKKALWDPPSTNQRTNDLPVRLTLASFGDCGTSTTHTMMEVDFRNSTIPTPNLLVVHTNDHERIKQSSLLGTTEYKQWVQENDLFIKDHVASQVLCLKIPGGFKTDVGRRAQTEALCNILNGLGEGITLKYPGILKEVKMYCPIKTVFSGWADLIGFGDENKSLRNHREDYKVWIVPVTANDDQYMRSLESALDIANRDSKRRRRVIGIFNYPIVKSAAKSQLDLRPPTVYAEHENWRVIESVFSKIKNRDTLQPYLDDRLKMVACDIPSATVMFEDLKKDYFLPVNVMWTLPRALEVTGLAAFENEVYVTSAMATLDSFADFVELSKASRRMVEKTEHCHVADLDPTFLTALRVPLPKEKLADVFKHACDTTIASSNNMFKKRLLRSNSKDKVNLFSLAKYDTEKTKNVLERFRQRAKDNLMALNKLSEVDPLERLLDETETDWECKHLSNVLFADLTQTLVLALDYTGIAQYYRDLAVNISLHYLSSSVKQVNAGDKIQVDMQLVDLDDDDDGLELEDVIEKRIVIRSISLKNPPTAELATERIRGAATALKEMAKHVLRVVVRQTSWHALHDDTSFAEPTSELFRQSLLRCLRLERTRFVQQFLKRPIEEVAKKIGNYFQRQINRLETFVLHSTESRLTNLHPGLVVSRTQSVSRQDIAKIVYDEVHTNLEKCYKKKVYDSLLNPALVEHLKDKATAIMNPRRIGLRLNNHRPFEQYERHEDDNDEGTRMRWIGAFRDQVFWEEEKVELSLDQQATLRARLQESRHIDATDFGDTYSGVRDALGAILGIAGGDICSREEFRVKMDEEECDDPHVACFQDKFNKACRRATEEEALDRVYTEYLDANRVNVGKWVMTCGHAIALLHPTSMPFLAPGGVGHIAYRYLPTSKNRPLTVATCLAATSQEDLGVDAHLYKYLQEGDTSAASIRRKLDAYESTGEDKLFCIQHECRTIAMVTGRAILMVIVEDDLVRMHEYVFKPEVTIEAPDVCKERLVQEFESTVFEELADTMKRTVYFGPEDQDKEQMDVIVMYKGSVYLVEGKYVGEDHPKRKADASKQAVEEEEASTRKKPRSNEDDTEEDSFHDANINHDIIGDDLNMEFFEGEGSDNPIMGGEEVLQTTMMEQDELPAVPVIGREEVLPWWSVDQGELPAVPVEGDGLLLEDDHVRAGGEALQND